MSDLIQAISIDWKYLEPQIVLILVTVMTSSLLVFYLQRNRIPKLVFDGVWKTNDKVVPTAIIYFLRIKREGGEGGIRGFRGFVGVKDKFDPKISQLLSKNSEIFLNDYLFLTADAIVTNVRKEIVL